MREENRFSGISGRPQQIVGRRAPVVIKPRSAVSVQPQLSPDESISSSLSLLVSPQTFGPSKQQLAMDRFRAQQQATGQRRRQPIQATAQPKPLATQQTQVSKQNVGRFSRSVQAGNPVKPEHSNLALGIVDSQQKPPRKSFSKRFAWLADMQKPQVAMISAAVVIFVLGISVSLLGVKTNAKVEAEAKKVTQTSQDPQNENAGDKPDETDPGPKAVYSYNVPPDQPKRISIPKLKVNARIKALGTKSNNELKAPTSIYDVGWYDKSSKPGQNGATLLDGHVHGLTSPGVFYNLKKLVTGDVIEVERGDGQVFKYRVVTMQSYDRRNLDMAAALTSAEQGKQGLNIITCTGSVEKDHSTYDKRLLVSAVRVD